MKRYSCRLHIRDNMSVCNNKQRYFPLEDGFQTLVRLFKIYQMQFNWSAANTQSRASADAGSGLSVQCHVNSLVLRQKGRHLQTTFRNIFSYMKILNFN